MNDLTTSAYDIHHNLTNQATPAGLTIAKHYNPSGLLTQEIRVQISWTNNFTYANGMVYTKMDERGTLTTTATGTGNFIAGRLPSATLDFMRKPRLKVPKHEAQGAYYHCISRTVHRRFLLRWRSQDLRQAKSFHQTFD